MTEGVAFGFTGTQQTLPVAQAEALGGVLGGLEHDGYIWMHNGDCIGADAFAAKLWRELGGHIWLHPPGISTKRAFFLLNMSDRSENPKPYRERNQDIVDSGELLVACPKEMWEELRSGTWMTVRMARKKGLPIIFVWPDGTVTKEA